MIDERSARATYYDALAAADIAFDAAIKAAKGAFADDASAAYEAAHKAARDAHTNAYTAALDAYDAARLALGNEE